jgi:hypothetical protein
MAISIRRAIAQGFERASAARGLVAGLWLVNLLVAGAAALVVGDALHASLGGSLVADRLRTGFDMGWYGEYQAGARGLESTFTPTVLGAAAFYNNLEAWLGGELLKGPPALLALGLGYLLLTTLLLGGILERLRGASRLSLAGFLEQSGRFFFRFLRLALMAAVLYAAVYAVSHWLMVTIEDATRNVTSERVVLGWTLAGTGLVLFLLALVNTAFDYAKIATVLDGRRQMLPTAALGFRFVLGRPGRTLGLCLALALVGVALLAVYAVLAPGARTSNVFTVLLAFLLGQVYLMARTVLRLTFYGSEMVLYQALARRF